MLCKKLLYFSAHVIIPCILMAVLTAACNLLANTSRPSDTAHSQPTKTSIPSMQVSTINVDSCGANPFDNKPDSDAIQKCIDQAKSGDTITFTSGKGKPEYQGYLIDKTLFLVDPVAKNDLTFTSMDQAHPALLKATPSLKGYVVHLYPRSRIKDAGKIDNITVSYLHIDGGSDSRVCFGKDNKRNGVGDNWGSWLPSECNGPGDDYCSPGTLGMLAFTNNYDTKQDYHGNPDMWSTGLTVDSVTLTNTECSRALLFFGADGTIRNSTIATAGDHVHVSGCAMTDNDEGKGGWADGITFKGPDITVTGNTVVNASDVGIVFFGGRNSVISDNTVQATKGNHGMFAAIGVHPWDYGDVSGVKVTGNKVINQGDSRCGGIHAGIDLGPQMWSAGCTNAEFPSPIAIGDVGSCAGNPTPPQVTYCKKGEVCQQWGYVAPNTTFTLQDNSVSGATVNYLVEGLDVEGKLNVDGNISIDPSVTDWEAAKNGCQSPDYEGPWKPLDKVAHDPSLPDWVDRPIHCER